MGASQVGRKKERKKERLHRLGLRGLRKHRAQSGWHKGCLDPPLKRVPKGNWFCPKCVRTGKDQQWIGPVGAPQEPLGEQVVVQQRRGHPPKRGLQEDQFEAAMAVLVDAAERLYSVTYED